LGASKKNFGPNMLNTVKYVFWVFVSQVNSCASGMCV
jgi:hypothetical protein